MRLESDTVYGIIGMLDQYEIYLSILLHFNRRMYLCYKLKNSCISRNKLYYKSKYYSYPECTSIYNATRNKLLCS